MPVKSNPKTNSAPSVQDDLAEFASRLTTTLQDLKSVGPPPIEIRDAIDRAPLGKRLGVLLSSTSTIAGDLSRAGLLERAEDDEDRRRTIVRLDEDYREAMEAWLEVAVAPIRIALERLSPQDRAHFLEGWRILQEEAALRGSDEDQSPDCEP